MRRLTTEFGVITKYCGDGGQKGEGYIMQMGRLKQAGNFGWKY